MSYLNEAFKELDELEDEVDLQNEEDVKKGLDFLKGDADNTDRLEMVVDIDADEEDELQDSYVGEILLMCPACHTLHYAHEDDIVPSEDETSDFVNVGEPCPHCKQEDGFEIKGKVAEYVPEGEESKEDEDDNIDNFDDLDDIEDEETEEEKLQFEESVKRRKQYVESVAEDNLDDLARLTGIELPMTKKVVAPKTKSLNENLTEAPLYDLKPQYDARQSFYNKATVDTDDKGKNKLYSYNTLVAEMKDGKPVVYGTFSQTTLRHIKEWLKQNGFKAENSKQIMADYGAKRESCKESTLDEGNKELTKNQWNKVARKLAKDDAIIMKEKSLDKIEPYFDIELEDDGSPYGGTSFAGETVGDFIQGLGEEDIPKNLYELNKLLKQCGLKMIKSKKGKKVAESTLDDIDAQADNKKEVAKQEFEKKIDDADADRDNKLDEAHYNDKTGEVEPDYFYGIEGVEFIDHGEWADPEVVYNGKTYNYYALEDTLYDDFKDRVASGEIIINTDGYEDLPRGSKEEQAEMDAFENFVTENKELVFEILDELAPVEEGMTEGCHKEEPKEEKKEEAKKVTIEESARKVTLEDGKVYVNGELKEGLVRVKYNDAWYIVDEDTDEEIDGPFDTLKDTEDYGYGHLEYICPRSDEAVEKPTKKAPEITDEQKACKDEECKKKELDESLLVTADFDDYKPWSGAVDTYERLEEEGKLGAFEDLLEELYPEGISMVGINDILWFDWEWVFESLGITDEEEEAEDEEEVVEEDEFEESLFENLVNRYCSRVYENVGNYKATACSREGKNFIVEGMLTYKNGKQEPTKFAFVENKGVNNIIKYVGLNETFSNNKKAFTLNLTKDGNKLLSESLYYNYNTKVDNKNYSVKGKVATPKRK